MIINFIKNKNKIIMGEEIDVEFSNKITKKLILGPAKKEKKGEECFISAEAYLLQEGKNPSRKEIYLGPNYRIKCIANDKFVFPLLRTSFGREKNYFKNWQTESHWERKKLIGEDCLFWPIIEKREEIK